MSSNELKFDFKYKIILDDCYNINKSFKIIIIGDSGVGKSYLSQMALRNNLNE